MVSLSKYRQRSMAARLMSAIMAKTKISVAETLSSHCFAHEDPPAEILLIVVNISGRCRQKRPKGIE